MHHPPAVTATRQRARHNTGTGLVSSLAARRQGKLLPKWKGHRKIKRWQIVIRSHSGGSSYGLLFWLQGSAATRRISRYGTLPDLKHLTERGYLRSKGHSDNLVLLVSSNKWQQEPYIYCIISLSFLLAEQENTLSEVLKEWNSPANGTRLRKTHFKETKERERFWESTWTVIIIQATTGSGSAQQAAALGWVQSTGPSEPPFHQGLEIHRLDWFFKYLT